MLVGKGQIANKRDGRRFCVQAREKSVTLQVLLCKRRRNCGAVFFVGDGARAGVSCKTCEKASKICDETRARNRRFCRGIGKTCSEIYVSSLLCRVLTTPLGSFANAKARAGVPIIAAFTIAITLAILAVIATTYAFERISVVFAD